MFHAVVEALLLKGHFMTETDKIAVVGAHLTYTHLH